MMVRWSAIRSFLAAFPLPAAIGCDSVIMERGYEQGVNWLTVKVEGAEHSERAWRQRVHIPLTMFLGK